MSISLCPTWGSGFFGSSGTDVSPPAVPPAGQDSKCQQRSRRGCRSFTFLLVIALILSFWAGSFVMNYCSWWGWLQGCGRGVGFGLLTPCYFSLNGLKNKPLCQGPTPAAPRTSIPRGSRRDEGKTIQGCDGRGNKSTKRQLLFSNRF